MKTPHPLLVLLVGLLLIVPGLESQAGPLDSIFHPECGQEGDGCWAADPCCDGLHCLAGEQKCYPPRELGEACHATAPCAAGLSCQPGVHKCYHSPRRMGEACAAGYGCMQGFHCQAGNQVCVPDEVDPESDVRCGDLRIEDLSSYAREEGRTHTYGTSLQTSALASGAEETGTVYGRGGEFGCYVSTCVGVHGDLAIAWQANFGIYELDFDGIPGRSNVQYFGASLPFIELGGSAAKVAALPDTGGRVEEVGAIGAVSLGVGLSMVDIGNLVCTTRVIGEDEPLRNLGDAWEGTHQDLGRGWSGTNLPPAGATKCADEGGRCAFSGTRAVWYGAQRTFAKADHSGGVDCNNGVFGDPIPGVVKACYIDPAAAITDGAPGSRVPVGGPGTWVRAPILMTAHGGQLYVIENQTLYRVDPNTGAYTSLGQNWAVNPVAMTSLGGSLYVIEDQTLWRVDPSTGAFVNLGRSWVVGAIAMTAHGDHLYIIEDQTLYRVDPNTGAYTSLGQNWKVPPLAITSLGAHLYIIENQTLWRVDPNTGGYTNLGQAWKVPPLAMTAYGGQLYIVEGTSLYRVDPSSGGYVEIGRGWRSAPLQLTALDGALYGIEGAQLWRVTP